MVQDQAFLEQYQVLWEHFHGMEDAAACEQEIFDGDVRFLHHSLFVQWARVGDYFPGFRDELGCGDGGHL